MQPVEFQLPASIPGDLQDEFSGIVGRLGPVTDTSKQSYAFETITLILAAIAAAESLMGIADKIMEWREKARKRCVRLDEVRIVAGDRQINLKDTDSDTLGRFLEGLRPS